MALRPFLLGLWLLLACWAPGQESDPFGQAFVNFETAPVHPIALSPDGTKLAVCNLADGKLELFDITSGQPVSIGFVPVGLDPVSVRFRNASEAWVVNQVSDSISVVDVTHLQVQATISTFDMPADVVFAGDPRRAFVSCALANTVQVFHPDTRELVTNVVIEADRPKALAVSPDGRKVYAAVFESGNGTTLVGAKFRNLLFIENAVSLPDGPYGGQNPPPNHDNDFQPPLNPNWPTNVPPAATGLIVRKNADGRWLDDNQRDWTEYVSGAQADLTQRVPGWDMPDRDLAVIDTDDLSVQYATGLMNLCMGLEVNPISGQIAVVGTDAINEVRFEPILKGIFVRVKLALIDPVSLNKTILDLNPHLDYSTSSIPQAMRELSVGDPRGVAWTTDGTRGYVAGMGSRNLVVIDANGERLRPTPIELGEGPCGLALDEARQRLYVFNRFSSSISVIDTENDAVITVVSLLDPTPLALAAGRRHLYDTRRTSGLGQASCASCHVDARMDRLAWDLGHPGGEVISMVVNHQGTLVTNDYHPLKGVMMTQTLQDIIGHEPFHWRGDKPHIESFNATFTNLQGAATSLEPFQMRELRDFLASVRFPPNPYRGLDNALPTDLPLPGHYAVGDDQLPAGASLPNGNAVTGLALFNHPANFCRTCHTLPTGLGLDKVLQEDVLQPVPAGPNGEHHFPLAFRLEGPLRSKISQFRNLAEKVGMDGLHASSRAGFGFGHDGSIDSLARFLQGVRIIRDQDKANLIAFLLSVAGSDTVQPGDPEDSTPPAGVGRQLTLTSSNPPPVFASMLALARSSESRVELVAQGRRDGQARGWFFDREGDRFQSDRQAETETAEELLALAETDAPLTFTLVSLGTGRRLGIDRDLDGQLNQDEREAGSNPSDSPWQPRILAFSPIAAIGTAYVLESLVPPLPAPGSMQWWKEDQPLLGETNARLSFSSVSMADDANYHLQVTTPFQSWTSVPVHLKVVPLLVTVSPSVQMVRPGSNVLFTAEAVGLGPFQYRWQFNGQDLPEATDASLWVANAQLANEGDYDVVVMNNYGTGISDPVFLGLLINPSLVVPPLSQRVGQGGDAVFGFEIAGHPPPFGYLLRKGSLVVTNYLSSERTGFLTLSDVQAAQAGTYRIVVTNAANPTPGLTMNPVTLTVLTDTDGDGVPDEWETAHGFDPNQPADAMMDADLDGASNCQEYESGTDPRDGQSVLRWSGIDLTADHGAAILRFFAPSNTTYSVAFRNEMTGGGWSKLQDILGLATNRMISVTNTVQGIDRRIYRLVTPRQP